MKRLLLFIAFFFFGIQSYSQSIELSANGLVGVTLIDVESALETELEDWSTFSYGFYLQGSYEFWSDIHLGVEFGYHRLYYWEEYYLGGGLYDRYRWNDAATIFFGPYGKADFNNFFVLAGFNIRIFTDESGVVPGLLLGGGYEIPIGDNIAIPLGIRTDIVFGSGVPVAVDLMFGFKYIIH